VDSRTVCVHSEPGTAPIRRAQLPRCGNSQTSSSAPAKSTVWKVDAGNLDDAFSEMIGVPAGKLPVHKA